MLKASKYEASHKIRFLFRAVTDDDVDRMQVYRQGCHSRALLIARPLFCLPRLGGIYLQFRGLVAKPVPVCFFFSFFFRHVILIQVAIAPGFHLFPFRTEKLSPVTPMVLRNSGRVGSRRLFLKWPLHPGTDGGAFCFCAFWIVREIYLYLPPNFLLLIF